MHVGVFADIEGSFGIYRMRQCRVGTGEWQYGRSCLTEDVNQVVKGAIEGGADQVTVKDTHEMGFNCLIDQLDDRAEYIGGHYARPCFFGKYTNYDLVLYVAIHAASGTENAFFPHTHYGIFSEVRLNGRPVCEMDIYAAYLGEMGIPVGFVSGEDVAVEQALNCLPWAKSVLVDKHQEAYQAGDESLRYLASGREKLRMTAVEAVKSIDTMKPLVVSGPLQFEAEFRNEQLAGKYNTWGFKQNGRVVSFSAENMMDGFDELNKLVFFPKKIYPFRRQFLFMMRTYSRIRATYFAPKPVAG